jgi:hypothetical protein
VTEATETIAIPMPTAVATQTYAVAKDSAYPNLLDRLRHRLRDDASRAVYNRAGFAVLDEATDTTVAL